ncbi:MAG: lysophospholipase [Deltaproteobacteria bacterium]|nr:lysophospholipase [Deltaproteobacteria bacterium]
MTEAMQDTTFTYDDPDGFKIFVRRWAPPAGVKAKAVVQIAHGAAEHSLRYERFARFLNQAGYIAYANDHRGHWMTAGSLDKAGKAGDDGWNGIVKDAKLLTDIIKKENPGLPVFLFGHSMGSLLSQHYIQQWGSEIAGVVLCGSSGARPDMEKAISTLEKLPRDGIAKAMFSEANKRFEPGKTGFEWLSRDEEEVQKYVDDPWCGFSFTFGFSLDLLKGIQEGWKPENEARIPKNLPIYIVSGADDPAAGEKAENVKLLIQRYKKSGIKNLMAKLYPGARHEILNETNRGDVQRDLRNWFDALLRRLRSRQPAQK